jgi:CHAT domain-containing protein
MGQPEQALPLYERAFTIGLMLPTPAERSLYSGNLCIFHRDRRQVALAIFYCKLAVNQYQHLRQGARELDATLQRSLSAQGEPTYRELAKLLIQQGRIAEAEQVLGMLKEYEYFEFVRRDAQSDPRATHASYTPAEQALVDRLEENAQSLSALYAQLDALQKIEQRTPAQEAERARLDEARSLQSEQLAALMEDIQVQFTLRKPVTTAELEELDELKGSVRDTLAELHDRTGVRAAMLYLLPGQKSTTFLVITKDGPFSVQGGESEERLKTLIAQLRQEIQARDPHYRATADTLYRALIQPVRTHLESAGVDSLMLYLTEYLRYLPFAALYDRTSGQHLIEHYALSIYTHVARETLRDEPVRRWSAVGLGLSEARPNFRALPAVEQELRQLVRDPRDEQPAGVFAGRRYLNAEFTRLQLKRLVDGEKRYSVMHVATHFNLAPGNEERSFLLAGDGDEVTLKQIRTDAGIKFRSFDLVTLSACETFIGTGELSGSEVEGLGTLLQKQGAKSVLATLWRVEDAGTARLMGAFYKARGEERLTTKAEALRQAQRALLTGEASAPGVDLRHPYFWASFVLMGNWM